MQVELAVQTHGVDAGLRQFPRGDGIDLAVPVRQPLWLPRPERRGQIHDHQVPHRAAAPDCRHHDDSRHRPAGRSRLGQTRGSASCRRTSRCSTGSTAEETLTFVAQVHGIDTGTANAAIGGSARPDGPQVSRHHAGDRFLARDAEEALARGSAPARAKTALSRRTVRGDRCGCVARK